MIQITDNIWIGDSDDQYKLLKSEGGPTAAMNVAQDLHGIVGWGYGVEYAQVGLVDGPGNLGCAYAAALLTLCALLDRHEQVLVYCHDGGRAMAVVVMHLILKRGKVSAHPTFLNHWAAWGKMVEELQRKLDRVLPEPHDAHREAFEKLPLSLIEGLT